MKFGICSGPTALGEPARLFDTLKAAGADYVEWGVGSVMASEDAFEGLRAAVAGAPLQVEAFNGYIPPQHRITGPDVNLSTVLEYAHEAARRCRALGAEVIVLGSGGARKVPDGFPVETAMRQFAEFCRELGPLVGNVGITIAIEPLNTREDNLITSIATGALIVDEVAHPNIKLLADYYHMFMEDEPFENVVQAGARLRHTHLADLGRVAPGYAEEGEADFVGFFRALRAAGYDERVSFEGGTKDLATQAKPLLDHMKTRHAEAQS